MKEVIKAQSIYEFTRDVSTAKRGEIAVIYSKQATILLQYDYKRWQETNSHGWEFYQAQEFLSASLMITQSCADHY